MVLVKGSALPNAHGARLGPEENLLWGFEKPESGLWKLPGPIPEGGGSNAYLLSRWTKILSRAFHNNFGEEIECTRVCISLDLVSRINYPVSQRRLPFLLSPGGQSLRSVNSSTVVLWGSLQVGHNGLPENLVGSCPSQQPMPANISWQGPLSLSIHSWLLIMIQEYPDTSGIQKSAKGILNKQRKK